MNHAHMKTSLVKKKKVLSALKKVQSIKMLGDFINLYENLILAGQILFSDQ